MKIKYDELFSFNESSNDDGKGNFFTNNSPDGYYSKQDFANGITELVQKAKSAGRGRCWELTHIEQLFNFCKINAKLTTEPTLVPDDGGEYIWCNFRIGNIRKTLKIANVGGKMYDFIKDYALAKVKATYTFKELWEEATS